MRKLLIAFMLVLLPVQWGWAMAASYCRDYGRGAAHFGHHEHDHAAERADSRSADAASAAGDVATADGTEVGCAVCHLGSAAALWLTVTGIRVAESAFAAPDPGLPRLEAPVGEPFRPPLRLNH